MEETIACSGGRFGASARPVDLVHLSHYRLGDRAFEGQVIDLFARNRAHIASQL